MKQTITVRRVETRTLEVEVPQAISPKTIESLANAGAFATVPIVGQLVGQWENVAVAKPAKPRKPRR